MESETRDKEVLKIIKRKAPGTIAIFDCKGFYRCYGEDVYVIANQILMSNVGIQTQRIGNGSDELVYHNLNNAQYTRAVRDLLLLLRYRVELYAENSNNVNAGSSNYYVLKAKGVLGNLVDFEQILSDCVELAELSTIGSIRLLDDDLTHENRIALAFCNSEDLRIVLAELNDTVNYTQFEQCAISLQPRECILLKQDSERAPNKFKKMEIAIQRTGIQQKNILAEQSEHQLSTEECKEKVLKVVHKKYIDLQFPSYVWHTLHTLLAHMQLLEDTQYESAFSIIQYGAAGHMYMSNASLQALDIFAVDAEIDNAIANNSSSATLYDHINRCRSQSGKRLIRDWLRRPLFSLRQIEERLDVVEAFSQKCASARQSLHEDLLRRVPDIGQLTRKLVQKKANLQDCYRLYLLILLLRRIEYVLRQMEQELDGKLWSSVKELLLEQIQHSRVEFERFETLIESTLDLDYFEQNGQHRIKPEIDENLAEIDDKMDESEKSAKKLLARLAERLQCEVKLESNSEYGFFFRITLKSESALRNIGDVKILDSTKGGGVRFQTKSLSQLNEEFRELLQSYETTQAELTKMVISTCAGYAPAFHSLSERIAVLDVLTAFAVVAASSPTAYVRPKVLEKGTGILVLRECRHPVIEHLSGMQYIPNDLVMGNVGNADNGNHFMVITGANMAGKSTFLKSAALTVLLGQMGCFVPCSEATFSMIDGIYTRIGAGDYQCKGISTFMSEMMDCATILEKATQFSLILIDELGRGTSTYDGFGLAWAIAEHIIERIKCFCLFATHFHEISELEQRHPGRVKNFRMETLLEDDKLTLLFQVVPGVSDKSFGLNIARMVGFPSEIINDAENVLHHLEAGELPCERMNSVDIEELLKKKGSELREAILKNFA